MKYYYPIEIPNLQIIQDKVFKLFPNEYISKRALFYLPNELFLNVTELKATLDTLGLTNSIRKFGFMILPAGHRTALHVDSGDTTFSLNIPIRNYVNTKVDFYTSTVEPVNTHDPNSPLGFWEYNLKDCVHVDTIEMTGSNIINVKEIHMVTNNNILPRITLLIRLDKDFIMEQRESNLCFHLRKQADSPLYDH